MNPNFSNNTSNNPHDVNFVDHSALGAAARMIQHVSHLTGDRNTNAPMQAPEFEIGARTTCQFGNPGDTDWSEKTHGNIPVVVIAKERCTITQRMYYLVQKVDDAEYIGRAGDVRGRRGQEHVQGELYCTNARMFGSKAQKWTGITTKEGAAKSLGFTL